MIYIDPMVTTTKNHLKKVYKDQRQGNLIKQNTKEKQQTTHTHTHKKEIKSRRKTIKTAQE